MGTNKLYDFSLIIPSILIWSLMIGVKYADYDTNVVFFGLAALLSLASTLAIVVISISKWQIIKDSALVTIIFLVTSSPLSIYLFIEFIGIKMRS